MNRLAYISKLSFSIVFSLCCCQLFGFKSIEFTQNKGLIFLEAEVNGEKGRFIFDTGTNHIFLNGKPISQDATFNTIDKELKASRQLVQSFKLGAIEQNEIDAWLVDLDFLESTLDTELSGVLGFGFFHNYDVIIDYESNRIYLYEFHEKLPLSFANVTSTSSIFDFEIDGLPTVELSFKGQKFRFGLDTGANVSVFDTAMMKDLNFNQAEGEEIQHIESLDIGIATIKNLPYQVKSLNHLDESKNLDGIIGLCGLNLSKLYIDNQSKKLCLQW